MLGTPLGLVRLQVRLQLVLSKTNRIGNTKHNI